jgi:cytochrome c peroxidase
MSSFPTGATRLLLGVAAVLVYCRGTGSAAEPYQWNLPAGFPQPSVPDDNPMSIEKVALGRFIFYDTRMSGNQTYSSATGWSKQLGPPARSTRAAR